MPLPLLQPASDSTPTLILGYAIMGAVGLIYLISLWLRHNKLQREREILERLIEEE